MYRIESKIDTSSSEFQENKAYYQEQLGEFKKRQEVIKAGGPPKARERQKARGKLSTRERIEKLLDRNSPFLEFSQFAAYDLYDKEASAAGVITGKALLDKRFTVAEALEILQ